MEEPKKLTDITLVIYPSNHVLTHSPKVILLGKGKEWKDEIVKEANNYWTDSPLTFLFLDDENYDSDRLSWLFLNIKNSDFIVGKISSDIEDVSLIAPFVKETTTFLLFDSILNDTRNWFETLNPNKNIYSSISIVLRLKDFWLKSIK